MKNSSGFSGRLRGRDEKHEIYAAAFGGHLFMTYFYRAGGGGVSPSLPVTRSGTEKLHSAVSSSSKKFLRVSSQDLKPHKPDSYIQPGPDGTKRGVPARCCTGVHPIDPGGPRSGWVPPSVPWVVPPRGWVPPGAPIVPPDGSPGVPPSGPTEGSEGGWSGSGSEGGWSQGGRSEPER